MRAKLGGCMFLRKKGAKLVFSGYNGPIPVRGELITARRYVE